MYFSWNLDWLIDLIIFIISLQSDHPLGRFRKTLRKRTVAQSTVSCCTAVTAGHDHMHFFLSSCQRRGSPTPATKHIYLSTLWRLSGQDAGSSFFSPSLFSLLFSLLIEADPYQAPVALTPVASPSSVRPVDSRVAAGQPIMNWPWSGVSEATVASGSFDATQKSRFPTAGSRLGPVNNLPVAC